ncbi:transketolase family protein [Mangrovibacterium lignilyticum]|uniref:transketolase family protein n=1 Tax=Mangrovibacterium lignilyticum TaxID=2668052 RepID=UPI0013D26CE0|nr:transketolase C-terminal domain-containing protein [Mangrovibacterium lignilyticum]
MSLKALELGKANLEEFSATMIELAEKDSKILAVTSDSRGSGKLVSYAEKLPEQIVEVGIAEQNLVGVAAGLASTGKSVFAVSPACFLATRSLEQIKNDVAYSNYPVSLIGISAGVSYGALGTTHHSLHDIAALRAMHNMQIVIPADNFETREVITYAAQSEKPIFIKFGKKNMPHLPRVNKKFEIGKASVICEGSDVAFIACGETVAPAYEAARLLEEKGISAEVVSMHTISPLDEAAILKLASKCKAIITVEEHSVHGGLGEACAAVLLQNQAIVPFKIVGIPDEDTVPGSQGEIFDYYGISGEGLTKTALNLLK